MDPNFFYNAGFVKKCKRVSKFGISNKHKCDAAVKNVFCAESVRNFTLLIKFSEELFSKTFLFKNLMRRIRINHKDSC